MFRVSFCNAEGKRQPWLTLHLPAVPEVGEVIRFRERANHTKPAAGRVSRREWDIVEREPAESWVTVYVTFD
jgi:hypothetical protein